MALVGGEMGAIVNEGVEATDIIETLLTITVLNYVLESPKLRSGKSTCTEF